jgi:phage gpG-like protein
MLCVLQDFLRSGCDLEVSLKDLRLLLPTLSADAAAIAGQAVALSQWHQVGGAPHASAQQGSSINSCCARHLLTHQAVMPVAHLNAERNNAARPAGAAAVLQQQF